MTQSQDAKLRDVEEHSWDDPRFLSLVEAITILAELMAEYPHPSDQKIRIALGRAVERLKARLDEVRR